MEKQYIFSIRFIAVALVLAFLSGCAATKEKVEIYWPLPPDLPRIAYLGSLAKPTDLEIRKSWWMRIKEFLFGRPEEPHLIRPYAVFVADDGRVYITDTGLQVVHIFDLEKKEYEQIFSLNDGMRLIAPVGITGDLGGRIYVADSLLNQVFVFDREGRQISVFGGPDLFKRVTGIALNPINDLLYAVDTGGHRLVILDSSGQKQMEFGNRGDGDGEFNFPTHVVADQDGKIYVTDSMNFRIQVFEPDGRFVKKFGQLGNRLGDFSKPKGVAVDNEGHIFVVEGIYDTVQIFDQEGSLLMNFGSSGSQEGYFWLPGGIAIDKANRIYVADTYNRRLQMFQLLEEHRDPVLDIPDTVEVVK